MERVSKNVMDQMQNELAMDEHDDLTPEEIAALSPEEFVPHAFDAKEAEAVGYSNYSYWLVTFSNEGLPIW